MADSPQAAGDPQAQLRAVDITDEVVPPSKGPDSPSTTTYDPRRDREKVRGRIAVLLLALLAGTILGIFLLLWLGTIDVPGAKELLAVLVSPLVGLVGAATGFYYGGKG